MLAQTGPGELATPLSWGRATALGLAWAFLGTFCNAVLWVLWLGPSAVSRGYFLVLLVPPCLAAVVGGLVHRSQRVALLAGLLAVALSALALVLLVVLVLALVRVNP